LRGVSAGFCLFPVVELCRSRSAQSIQERPHYCSCQDDYLVDLRLLDLSNHPWRRHGFCAREKRGGGAWFCQIRVLSDAQSPSFAAVGLHRGGWLPGLIPAAREGCSRCAHGCRASALLHRQQCVGVSRCSPAQHRAGT